MLTPLIDLRMRSWSSLFGEIVGIFHKHKFKNFARPTVKNGIIEASDEMENI